MSTSFSGLGAALSSLIAQQRGLDVTGQNIANANTDGYSRQEVDLQSVGASTVPALWSTYQSAGQGVDVAGVQRIADTLLIGRSQAEHGQLATLSGSKTTMDTIETSFGEPSDTGLQTTLANFWASWHDVANDPSSNASRSVLLNQAQAVVDGVSKVSSALNDQWLATKGQLADTVQTVNNTISAVAQLNGTIMRNTASGIPSNELMDQRDQLVLQLADAVGATSKPQPDGSLSVFVSGTAVVSGPTARSLQITGGSSLANVPTDPAVLTWNGAGYPASIPAGQVGAMTAALNTTIPKYMAGIDGVATSLVSTVNAVHAAGYDAAGLPGGPFFSGTSAATLGVAITDPTKIAASGVALPVPNLDGSNATALADLASASAGADAGYRQLVSTLGAETASAGQRVSVQQATTASVDGARAAQSGVNLDEEMVNLMKYQHAYEGASRVINSVDSMLDTLINRTGLVGR